MTNPVIIGSASDVLWFTFCFRFRFAILLVSVILAEENEGFSFPETGQFSFFISQKRYISTPPPPPSPPYPPLPPKKIILSLENCKLNLPKRQISISRKLKYCNISEMTYFNLREWHILIFRNWSIAVVPTNSRKIFCSKQHVITFRI